MTIIGPFFIFRSPRRCVGELHPQLPRSGRLLVSLDLSFAAHLIA
jgi:hypothetical protein